MPKVSKASELQKRKRRQSGRWARASKASEQHKRQKGRVRWMCQSKASIEKASGDSRILIIASAGSRI